VVLHLQQVGTEGKRGGMLMGILSWILFGLVVGVIAKLLMPGRDPGGFIITILLGIAGALIGGFVGRAMGFYGQNEGAGWLMSILGAIILLALYRMMVRRRV
jgi:uncharacterized membrane protein YeaQ/YmgE (transglycosylase-associated protein family)